MELLLLIYLNKEDETWISASYVDDVSEIGQTSFRYRLTEDSGFMIQDL